MKINRKNIITGTIALTTAIFLFNSCSTNKGSAQVAFAETTPAVSIPKDSLEVAQALQTTFRSISSQVLPAVVEVDVTEKTTRKTYNPFGDLPFFFNIPDTQEYETEGLGSGFIVRHIGNTYYVLTNNHVAGNATTIKVKLHDEREFDGKLVGADSRIDIALVSFECNDANIPLATLGDSDLVQTGDICLALGSPMGYFASVTQGIVSATGRSGNDIGSISDFIQTDAAINQGNSGGPLVNIYGEVIGINTWIVSQSGGSQGLGFSIPINNVKSAIDQFISTGKVEYGWLGVQVMDADNSFREGLLLKNATGALVSEVFLNSPALKGGIQAGDFITKINGIDIKNRDQLVREVGVLKAGENASFQVIRGGKELSLTVKIEARNEDISGDSSKLWPGFVAQPLTDDLKKSLNAKNAEGVVVSSITSRTPAAALRLQNGDIITAVNGTKITNLAEFYAALDLTGKTEIWFDIYSDSHEVSTGHYKIEK